MRLVLPGLALSLLAATANAQSEFHFDLQGTDVVPPVDTRAGGYGQITLNSDQSVDYYVCTWRISGVDAAVYVGYPQGSGTKMATLNGGPTIWQGHADPISDSDRDDLLAGHCFVQVTSQSHPDGEIRGAVLPSPTDLAAYMTGSQVVPPVDTSDAADSLFHVNQDLTVSYVVVAPNLSGTAAHVHLGAVGANGPVLFDLDGGPTVWQGVSAPISTSDFASLQTMGAYVDVDTVDHPDGELRGQVIVSQIPYGTGFADSQSSVPPLLTATGEPTPGGTVECDLSGALPYGIGLAILATDHGAAPLHDAVFLLGGDLIVIPMQCEADGTSSLEDEVPDLSGLPSPFDVYIQFFGLDTALKHRIYASNAIKIPLVQI